MSDKIKLSIPDEVKDKYKGRCTCGGFMWEMGGKTFCSKCQLDKIKKEAAEGRDLDPERLRGYYDEKYRKKSPADGDTFKEIMKDRQFKD